MSGKDPLDDADRALFRDSVGRVRVLANDRAPLAARRKRGPVQGTDDAARVVDHMPDGWLADGATAGVVQRFARPGLQQRLLRRLARGQVPVEAELDLHGMNVERARRALDGFLTECRAHRLRCVRIVHGKGFGSPDAQPVLKAQVDRWLRLRDEVLAFHSAPLRDGGTGALSVLLRRR